MVRITVLLAALLAAGCSKEDAPPAAAAATSSAAPAQPSAKQLIASGAAVVDVRTVEEFAGGHLERAANIPVQELGGRIGEIEALVGGDRSKPVVLYCKSGRRATAAKQQLEAAGFTHVVNGGGYTELK